MGWILKTKWGRVHRLGLQSILKPLPKLRLCRRRRRRRRRPRFIGFLLLRRTLFLRKREEKRMDFNDVPFPSYFDPESAGREQYRRYRFFLSPSLAFLTFFWLVFPVFCGGDGDSWRTHANYRWNLFIGSGKCSVISFLLAVWVWEFFFFKGEIIFFF